MINICIKTEKSNILPPSDKYFPLPLWAAGEEEAGGLPDYWGAPLGSVAAEEVLLLWKLSYYISLWCKYICVQCQQLQVMVCYVILKIKLFTVTDDEITGALCWLFTNTVTNSSTVISGVNK